MNTKPVHKKSKKREQIIKTAKNLFMQHGIKRVAVEEICKKAGASKMTFYKYFPNKIELVKHIWRNIQEEGFNKLDEINGMDIPLPEKIQLMFNWKQEFASNMSEIFIEEILPIHMEHMDLEGYKKRFMQFIVNAQKRGEVRRDIRPEFFIAVLDKLQELAFDEELIKKYPNFMEFNREIKDFLWFGFYARPDSGK
jgi:AcrR family transcriptional regulator